MANKTPSLKVIPLKAAPLKNTPAVKARLTILSRRKDFLRLIEVGRRVRPAPWLLINFSLNEYGKLRCGWTLPRKVGNAVIRNKLKRWSREFFRSFIKENGNSFPVDINLVFRKTEDDFYRNLDYEAFSKVLLRGWNQLQRDDSIHTAFSDRTL